MMRHALTKAIQEWNRSSMNKTLLFMKGKDIPHRENVLCYYSKRACYFIDARSFSSQSKTPENINPDLSQDEELHSILKDIMSDFDDTPPTPPDGGNKSKEITAENVEAKSNVFLHTNEKGDTTVSLGTTNKFTPYKEDEQEEILDSNEEPDLYLYQEKWNKYLNVNKTRGVYGVFDLTELVQILKQENMQDLTVIEIPKSISYCAHMIICTGHSPRHLHAVAEFVRKLHKMKKWKRDPFIVVEGEQSKDWKVLDIGNIVVHLMLEEIRERYNLEMLWAVGVENDDLSQKAPDPLQDLLEQNMQYLQGIKIAN